jgi:hypothetical protein
MELNQEVDCVVAMDVGEEEIRPKMMRLVCRSSERSLKKKIVFYDSNYREERHVEQSLS